MSRPTSSSGGYGTTFARRCAQRIVERARQHLHESADRRDDEDAEDQEPGVALDRLCEGRGSSRGAYRSARCRGVRRARASAASPRRSARPRTFGSRFTAISTVPARNNTPPRAAAGSKAPSRASPRRSCSAPRRVVEAEPQQRLREPGGPHRQDVEHACRRARARSARSRAACCASGRPASLGTR